LHLAVIPSPIGSTLDHLDECDDLLEIEIIERRFEDPSGSEPPELIQAHVRILGG
jgi:hypothetical protein